MMWHVFRALPRLLWRHKMVLVGLSLLVILPAVLLTSGLRLAPTSGSWPAPGALAATATPDRPPALAEANMRALVELNAQAFWDTLSEDSKAELIMQGIAGSQDLERVFARARANGDIMVSYRFVARYDMKNGDTVSFFVATRAIGQSEQIEVPYLITTDANGYVKRVE